MRLLLVQSRPADDPMIEQEKACIARRLERCGVTWLHRNAVTHRAENSWLEGVDGVIFGGSGAYSVQHPKSAAWVTPLRHLLDGIFDGDVPCFGICFGHQLLGLHLGAPVITDPDREEVGTVQLRLTWEGRHDPLFSQLGDVFPVHTGHSDHVVGLPPGVSLLATGQGCTTQAFGVVGRPVYSTQFHPELLGYEARARFLTNKSDDVGAVDARSGAMAARFQPGADATAGLLAAFVDRVVTR